MELDEMNDLEACAGSCWCMNPARGGALLTAIPEARETGPVPLMDLPRDKIFDYWLESGQINDVAEAAAKVVDLHVPEFELKVSALLADVYYRLMEALKKRASKTSLSMRSPSQSSLALRYRQRPNPGPGSRPTVRPLRSY